MKIFYKKSILLLVLLSTTISFHAISMEAPPERKEIEATQEPITLNIEALWKDLKNRIAINRELKSRFAKQQQIMSPPIPSNITIQSLTHLEYIFGPGKTEAEYINEGLNEGFPYPYPMLIRGLNNQYQSLVRKILEQEKVNWNFYTFYHGQHGALSLIHDIMQVLYGWFNIETPDEQTKFLRLFTQKTPEYKNVSEFLQATKNINISGNITHWDHIPAIQKYLLSTNLALFGNAGDEDESTWNYFVAGISINPPDLQAQITEFFKLFDFNPKFIEPILQASTTYLEQNTLLIKQKSGKIKKIAPGNLYQIFIHPSVINEIAYLSDIGGTPLAFEERSYFLPIPGSTQVILPETEKGKQLKYLQQHVFDPTLDRLNIDRYLTLLRTKKIPATLEATINQAQARILLKYSVLLDPKKVKIIKYKTPHTRSDLADAERTYQQRLSEIMQEAIKEWLFRKRAKTGEKTRLELLFELLKRK